MATAPRKLVEQHRKKIIIEIHKEENIVDQNKLTKRFVPKFNPRESDGTSSDDSANSSIESNKDYDSSPTSESDEHQPVRKSSKPGIKKRNKKQRKKYLKKFSPVRQKLVCNKNKKVTIDTIKTKPTTTHFTNNMQLTRKCPTDQQYSSEEDEDVIVSVLNKGRELKVGMVMVRLVWSNKYSSLLNPM